MATAEDIAEVLRGKKVFDGRKWRVYDADGVELASAEGVLWRGNPGALLWNLFQRTADVLIRMRRRMRR